MNSPFPPDGRFQVLGTLGRGGFGAVYRALDRQAGREVAIKVSLERADAQRLQRFQREGELTARLDHPGIVRVHSAGEVGGYPYLVYELIEGTSLTSALPVTDLRRRVELIRDAARALAYAHEQGVVHRDVKGDNILVDAEGKAHVADFGLASAQDLERLTLTGAALGTPTHMSPEQVEGRRERLGPHTDVWALGVLLFQALTNELPFNAPSPMELVGAILHGEVSRPSKLNPRAPRALDAVCLRALERKPERRYPDAGAFAVDLDRYLAGEATGGAPGGRRSVVGAGLLLLAGLGSLLWFLRPATAPQSEAEVPRATVDPPVERPAAQVSDPAAERALSSLLRAPPTQTARDKLQAWIREHPGHPAQPHAQDGLEALGAVLPRVFGREVPNRSTNGYWIDDERLVVHGDDGQLSCYGLDAADTPLWTAKVPYHASGIARSPDGDLIFHEGKRGLVRLDPGTREVRPLPGTLRQVRLLAFGPSGQRLVLAAQGRLVVYRWPELTVVASSEAQAARSLSVSPDGARVAIGGGSWLAALDAGDGKVDPSYLRVLRLPDLTVVHDLKRKSPPSASAWHGEWLYEASSLGEVMRWPLKDPGAQEQLRSSDRVLHGGFGAQLAHKGSVMGMLIHEDVLYSVCRAPEMGEGRAEFSAWSTDDGRRLRVIEGTRSYSKIRISPDGRWLAVGTLSGVVEVYRARVDVD